ncbi:MAG: PAS domain S-box protein [Phycisphaerales bacterium]
MGTNGTAGGGGDDGARAERPVVPAVAAVPARVMVDSAEWLRVTLSCIGDGVITTDRSGRVTFLNPVAQALTGWTQEEATAGGGVPIERVFNIVNEETRAKVDNPALRGLREGITVGLANHTILISKDGTERPIDDSAAPIRSAGGETAGAVLVFRDVTEKKRQEKLVTDAFDYASNILATQREPFLVLDKALRVVSANRAFYRVFRVEKDATEGRFVYDLGDGQWNIPKLRELLEDVLPKNHVFEGFEVAHDFPSGVGHKTMLLNVRKVVRPGNNSELILLAIEDITERKQAQVAQRDSEVRYRRLFETAKDGILILDANTGKITEANAFMCGLTGMEAREILGKELHEIGMFKDVAQNKEAFRELQRTGYIRHEHLPVKHRGGAEVEVEFVANVYSEGERLVAQCNVRDISERSRLEKELAQQTAALAAQARGKDEFLAMLSHGLRNPLAPIGSAVHLMRLQERSAGGGGNPIQQQAREIIERQVANLTKMVSDLSEVSRVVSGRIRLDLEPVDLRRVVEHALQTVAPLLAQRRHSVLANLCAESVWAEVDPARIEEVLVNLLNNAAKYTPDGGRIGVACEHHVEAGQHQCLIRVSDNGVGIDADLLPRIFDLFTQADRSLARSSGGLGIGLSLAQRLVTLHGGTIWAESAGAGQGSAFTIKLPLTSAPIGHGVFGEPPRAQGQAGADGPSGLAVRVLVVDDNVDLVTMLSAALRLKGYTVQSAYTGPDGLRVALEWRPDIVLLDIGLPGLDGYEVARRLRSDAAVAGGTRMRLIAITGYGQDSDIALTNEAGFDGHLTKPCDFEDLEKMMTAPTASM